MFQSKTSIAGVAVSLVVGVVLIVMQFSISTSLTSDVAGRMSDYSMKGGSYYSGKKDGPVLDPTRIVAPKGGNGKLAELDVTTDSIPSAEIVLDDGTGAVEFEPKVVNEPEAGLSEDAGFVEKAMFLLAAAWSWVVGDRGEEEDSYEMSCKPKKGGGKVCTIVR